jgi:hypothetical protein
MKTQTQAILFLLVIIIVGAVGLVVAATDYSKALSTYKQYKEQEHVIIDEPLQISSNQTIQPNPTASQILQQNNQAHFIFTAPQNQIAYTTTIENEQTVYDVLKKLEQEKKITMTVKESTLGVFIEAINGIENNTSNNTYWFLYKNGESANVGASALTVHPNDTIEWRYHEAQ